MASSGKGSVSRGSECRPVALLPAGDEASMVVPDGAGSELGWT